ncbi:hypothetical protein ANN_07394 [Periplaneta americana]|uniref:MADF domain-containing protein n=1 Tax=Periplaneta americana TaxID=6978 RepID=A0ABQ8SYH2_PERAM|nr:hypothetical protein ANN_07394 [Periplaneta americana]
MEQVLLDEILILSVEEIPHVYDKRRASYKDEKMKENTWLSIAASLNTDPGYTKWDHKRNEDVMEELQLEPVVNHVKHYQKNWINHLHRMRTDRIPKVMLHYRPNGKRSLGRPR